MFKTGFLEVKQNERWRWNELFVTNIKLYVYTYLNCYNVTNKLNVILILINFKYMK